MNVSRLDDALRKAHGLGLRVVPDNDTVPMDSSLDECFRILNSVGAPGSLCVDAGRILGCFSADHREDMGQRLARLLRHCRDYNVTQIEIALEDLARVTT